MGHHPGELPKSKSTNLGIRPPESHCISPVVVSNWEILKWLGYSQALAPVLGTGWRVLEAARLAEVVHARDVGVELSGHAHLGRHH